MQVVDEGLQVGTRRRLRKATSVLVAETGDNKEKVSLLYQKFLGLGTKPIKEPDVFGSPTIEELDLQVDELLARPFISEVVQEEEFEDQAWDKGEEEEDEEEGQRDVGPSAFEKRFRSWSLFSAKRLIIPPSRMIRKCMDVMMGCANHATIKSLRSLPLKHKCAILCRNMAEKFAFKQEIKELKFENDSTIEISSQMKDDIEMAMEENQNKVQTLEGKTKELQAALEKEKEANKKKENEL
ncbi:hypothetical protein Dimus_013761, partial [Dionaea muscipula]